MHRRRAGGPLDPHATGRGRRGASLGAFLHTFDGAGVPDDVALAIHHQLERWMADSGRAFSVGARDPLSTYGIAPDDVSAVSSRGVDGDS